MNDDLQQPLTGLSDRGAPRGAATVLAGARATVRARRRRRRAGVAAGGVLGLVTLIALVLGLGPDDGDTVQTEGTATTVPETTSSSSSTAPSSTAASTVPSTTPSTSSPPGSTATTAAGPSVDVRPGPDSTGPTDTSVLVRRTAEEVEAMMRPGAVIENVDIIGGNVDVVADDVTIRNFRLDAGGAPYGFRSTGGATGFVAEDGEIHDTSSAGFWGSHATLRRLDVHDSDAGAFKPVTGVTIERSWWHHLGRGTGSANGVQFQGDTAGTSVVIRNNFCDLPTTVPAPYGSSSCVIVSTDAPITASIDHNWFTGGNYTVDCNGQATVAVHDNRFDRDHRYGPVTGCPNATDNAWTDTGTPIP